MPFHRPIRALILDMDGVLWTDREPIGDLPAVFARIQAAGLQVMLATNNATRTPAEHLAKLAGFGVRGIEEWQVVNSALATAFLIKQKFPQGGPVYMVAENGVVQALASEGFHPVNDAAGETPLAVVAGLDREVSYEKLRRATLYIRAGVRFYGTNLDATYPTPEGLVPGAGTILAAIQTAGGVAPITAGKPAPYMLELGLQRMGVSAAETLVVGDRLDTDIAGGQALGCPVALVLTGVSTRADGEAWRPSIDILANDLTSLLDQVLA